MYQSWRPRRTRRPDFEKKDIRSAPATRFFDQLSFIGDEIVGCFPLETSEGIVLVDCMNPDQRSVDMIRQGFKDLGLDIRQLKAVLISHGHGDHFGMAGYFKETYGCRIYMSRTDHDLACHMPSHFPWEPVTFQVDHYLLDGEILDFGDTRIRAVSTPGHSPGCFSFIIPVTDDGIPHRMALWGGSGILPDSDREAYAHSLDKFSRICQEEGVDGEISTHPALDMGLERLELARNITNGIPNPFVLGRDGYHYYEQIFYDLLKHAGKQ